MPLSLNLCLNVLESYLNIPLDLVLLTDSPANDRTGTVGINALDISAISSGAWPTCGDWTVDVYGAVATIANAATVNFGAFAADVTLYGIAALEDGRLRAWAPFVDASGAQVRRSFTAGDAITLPAGAFSVCLA